MKKALITGSEGFIGKHLQEHLKKLGKYEIIRFDIKLNCFHDIRNKANALQFVKEHKPDMIIHLAANPDVGASVKNPYEDLVLNAGGTVNMLEAAKEAGVELFILTSTAQVYGEQKQEAMAEDHPISPISPYAESKLAAENYCEYYRRKYNVPCVVFRFFNIYGPNQPDSVVVPILIKKIANADGRLEMYGSKEDSRDFAYVKDLCRGFELVMEKKPIGETINFCSGKETYILELAEITAGLFGKKIEFIYGGGKADGKISRMKGSCEKAKRLLGWEPKTGLEEGLREVKRSLGF